ncbi:MAG: hypothetical protein NPINA01_03960 [Nitrospinaceae bacterium]|nr:MAG: hypothetical protein NPINA01_03960 [Nitrospinaceae bacterium]
MNPYRLFKEKSLGKAIVYLLTGNLLLGIGYIALLPIWEGFDETAHFSYLQQVADTGTFPLDRNARISTDVEAYYVHAPVPQALSEGIPLENRLTYRSFFSQPEKFLSDARELIHDSPENSRKYLPGRGNNWQAQHPPLYYVFLSPVYLLTKSLSWAGQIFILRLSSYILAWIGLVVTVCGCLGMARSQRSPEQVQLWYWAALGTGLWPVLFPAWFSDMARMGNDSICCLLLSSIWFVSVRMVQEGLSIKYFFLLGLLLSLGCLTKAFFVPITFSVLGFWMFREWKLQGSKGLWKAIRFSTYALIIMLVMGWWWYWNNYVQYGVILGSSELRVLKEAGGLWKGLEFGYSFFQWVRGHVVLLVTVGWVGSWSFVKPPLILLFPIAFSLLWVMSFFLWALPRRKVHSAEWLPVWMAFLVLAGLSYHVLVRIALTGEGRGTSGYYIHILAGPLATALGISLYAMWAKRIFKTVMQIFFGYAVLFSIGITWAQALFFSGIAFAGENEKIIHFPESLPSFFGILEAFQRLKILVFPEAGSILWVSGWLFVIAGLVYARRFANHSIRPL